MGYSQCLMCKYVFGRTCKYTNEIIKEEIFSNEKVCENFSSITEEEIDCDDKCCSEAKRFHQNAQKYEKKA